MRRKRKPLPLLEKVEIFDTGSKGKAVGKADGKVVFIPFVVPGDIVDVQVYKKKRDLLEGKATHFHHYSERRTDPKCVHFGTCGGCKWQNMKYDEQLAFKQNQVEQNLIRIGHLELPEHSPILGSKDIFHYRNKLEYGFSNRKWVKEFKPDMPQEGGLGFHLPGMFDKVLDIDECWLQPEPSNKIRNHVRAYAKKHDISFTNPRQHEGFLRNLMIRTSNTGDVMVILIVREMNESILLPTLYDLHNSFPEITSLMYMINGKMNDSLYDLDAVVYEGKDHIIEQMPSFKDPNKLLQFKISAKSFFQTNTNQAAELYRKVAELGEFKGDELVYDLYTGTGTIAQYVSECVSKVIGLENVQDAIDDAYVNANLNEITNTSFFAGEIEKIMNDAFIEEHGTPDVIITDPPRVGMHQKVVDQIIKVNPEKVVYVSCNSATQARDVALLKDQYYIDKMQTVDMFPHTHHVENILLLKRR